MKKLRLITVGIFLFAIAGAYASNANNSDFLKDGYVQTTSPNACTLVHDVPDNCTTASGTFCGYYNAQKSGQTTTCITPLNHP